MARRAIIHQPMSRRDRIAQREIVNRRAARRRRKPRQFRDSRLLNGCGLRFRVMHLFRERGLRGLRDFSLQWSCLCLRARRARFDYIRRLRLRDDDARLHGIRRLGLSHYNRSACAARKLGFNDALIFGRAGNERENYPQRARKKTHDHIF